MRDRIVNRLPLQKLTKIDRSGLHHFMKFGRSENAFAFTRKYTTCLAGIDWEETFIGSYYCLEVAISALQFQKETDVSGVRHVEDIVMLEKKINDVRCYEEAVDFITGVLEAVTRFREQLNNKYAGKIIKAKDFIRSNSNRYDMSLQIVADHIGISPTYFSTIFSQETGQTFVEFLTSVRMNCAINLIQTTDYKTYEIAYKVGYNDAHYFSFLFKKFTGTTVREFRKKSNLAI